MQNLVQDRRLLLPVIAASVAIAIGSVLVILLSGDASGGGSASGPSSTARASSGKNLTIDIANFKYRPETVTVKAGSRVNWVNRDDAPHTATSGAFDTGELRKGQSKTLQLAKAGTYSYICQFHPFMKGTVIVK